MTEVIDLPLGYKNGYVGGMMVNAYYKKFRPKEFDETKVMYPADDVPDAPFHEE